MIKKFETVNIYDYVKSDVTDIIYNEALVSYSISIVKEENKIKLTIYSTFQNGYNDYISIDDSYYINKEEALELINIYKDYECI